MAETPDPLARLNAMVTLIEARDWVDSVERIAAQQAWLRLAPLLLAVVRAADVMHDASREGGYCHGCGRHIEARYDPKPHLDGCSLKAFGVARLALDTALTPAPKP